jgi:CRP-like cAMP-binding protein
MDDRMLAVLADILNLHSLSIGEELCRQGDPGDACFVIARGNVEVVIGTGQDQKVLASLGPCQVVGEVALIDGQKRSATLRCQTAVAYFSLKREDFERLLHAGNQASMQLLDNIANNLVDKVRSVNKRYTDIFSKSGETISQLTSKLSELRASLEASDEVEESEDLLNLMGYNDPYR